MKAAPNGLGAISSKPTRWRRSGQTARIVPPVVVVRFSARFWGHWPRNLGGAGFLLPRLLNNIFCPASQRDFGTHWNSVVHQRVFLSHSHVCLVHGKLRRRQHLIDCDVPARARKRSPCDCDALEYRVRKRNCKDFLFRCAGATRLAQSWRFPRCLALLWDRDVVRIPSKRDLVRSRHPWSYDHHFRIDR